MFGWFKSTDRIFWLGAFLLTVCFIGPTHADGTYKITLAATDPTITGPGSPQPPIYKGDFISVGLSATLNSSGTNTQTGAECTIDPGSEEWSYPGTVSVVGYGLDGKTLLVGPFVATISGVDKKTGNATLTAGFDTAGYYKLSYSVHVKYSSTTCGDGVADATGHLSYAVSAGDFSMTPAATKLDVVRGFDASTLVTINPLNGFSNTDAVIFSMYGQAGIAANGSATPAKPDYATVGVLADVPSGIYPTYLRGTATIGDVAIAHDVPMTINVLPFQIDGPYDKSWSRTTDGLLYSQVPNKRNPNSSITTDSVLVYTNIDGTGTYQWLGDNSTWSDLLVASVGLGPFSSHEDTFSIYNWTTSYTNFENMPNGSATYLPRPGYAYSGSTPLQNPTGPVGSETISLTALRLDGKSATNTYTIRWHYPSENWHIFSTTPPITAIAPDTTAYFIDGNTNKFTRIVAGIPAFFPVPPQKDAVKTIDGGTVSVYFGAASAAWPGLAEAAGLGTGPIGWGFAAILAAAGATAATMTPNTPTPIIYVSNYEQYCNDLDTESSHPSGLPSGYHHFISTGKNKILFAQAYVKSQYVRQNYPYDQGMHDIYYKPLLGGSSMTFTGKTAQTSRIDYYYAAGYNSHGFYGNIAGQLTVYTNYYDEFQWTYYAP